MVFDLIIYLKLGACSIAIGALYLVFRLGPSRLKAMYLAMMTIAFGNWVAYVWLIFNFEHRQAWAEWVGPVGIVGWLAGWAWPAVEVLRGRKKLVKELEDLAANVNPDSRDHS